MYFPSHNPSWKSLIRQLPFTLEDNSAVNHHFLRWYHSKHPDDKQAVDIWTYCYISRYFHTKLETSCPAARARLDEMVECAFFKVQRNLEKVDRPQRFSHWVSVICKHTFINHNRQQPPPMPLAKPGTRPVPAPPRDAGRFYDAEVTYDALTAAIDRLPAFLQRPARLRFLRYLSYQRISEITRKSVPTVRTYIHKATTRFKQDPELQVLREELLKGT